MYILLYRDRRHFVFTRQETFIFCTKHYIMVCNDAMSCSQGRNRFAINIKKSMYTQYLHYLGRLSAVAQEYYCNTSVVGSISTRRMNLLICSLWH